MESSSSQPKEEDKQPEEVDFDTQAEKEEADPIDFVESELKVKWTADTKDELRKQIESEPTYKDKVKKLLEMMKGKYEGNYRM